MDSPTQSTPKDEDPLVSLEYLRTVFKPLKGHSSLVTIDSNFPQFSHEKIFLLMDDAFRNKNRHMIFHVETMIKTIQEICKSQRVDVKDKNIAIIAALYHDFVKLVTRDMYNNDELIENLVDEKKFGHSLAAQRFFLYLGLPELAQAVRHNSPDFCSDTKLNTVTISQVLVNIADRIEYFGGQFRSFESKIILEGFDLKMEKKATSLVKSLYKKLLARTPGTLTNLKYVNPSQEKHITIVSRFDNKYHPPIGNYQDTSSALKIAKELEQLGWFTTIIHRGDFASKKISKHVDIFAINLGEIGQILPIVKKKCHKSNIVIVEGWTRIIPELVKDKKPNHMIAVIFRGLNTGKLKLDRAINSSQADRIWAVSKSELNAIIKSFKNHKIPTGPIQIIPNGIDTKIFNMKSKIKRESGKIVYVGAIRKEKGVQILIDALPEIRAHFRNAKLYLIGEEDMYGSGVKFSKTQNPFIFYLGQMKHKEIAGHLQSANLTVLLSNPNLFETFGKSIEEAKACGSRVLVSSSGALPERISSASQGQVIYDLSTKSIAQAILDQLNAKPTKMSYTEMYTWRISAIEVLTQYYQFLRSPAG